MTIFSVKEIDKVCAAIYIYHVDCKLLLQYTEFTRRALEEPSSNIRDSIQYYFLCQHYHPELRSKCSIGAEIFLKLHARVQRGIKLSICKVVC